MDRRGLLKASLLLSLAGLSGCGFTKRRENQFLANCMAHPPTDTMLRIDMHCHLMNARDSHPGAFVNRRILKTDPKDKNKIRYVNSLVSRVTQLFDNDYTTARSEANDLLEKIRAELQEGKSPVNELCRLGLPGESDLFIALDGTEAREQNIIGNGRPIGFVTSRTRNAAILMAQFPKVHLFTPSIVDFYEDDPEEYSDPARQMQFYSALAIATNGRFLPMVSFHPERYYYEVKDGHALNNLDLVRGAILNGGAIGVKVHPSSGFDPFSNKDYAYLTTRGFRACSADRQSSFDYKYEIMDEGMRKLYALCNELDVPILSHSGTSINVRQNCMQGDVDPNNWTNSTSHWSQALNQQRSKGYDNVRVALAHFAGGFGKMPRKGPTNVNPNPPQFLMDDEKLEPNAWVKTAIHHMNSNGSHRNMYLDMSVMNELAISQSFFEGGWEYKKPRDKDTRLLMIKARIDGGKFAKQFKEFFLENKILHNQTMYGSDWHMPSVSALSRNDAFMRLIENAIPDQKDLRAKVMGQNAVEFLGLKSGRQNRTRTETFLTKHGVKLDDVAWRKMID